MSADPRENALNYLKEKKVLQLFEVFLFLMSPLYLFILASWSKIGLCSTKRT
jgi:hypothetical protein